jgi:predicted ATP-grasp superfamily ATP-dependent carboligase
MRITQPPSVFILNLSYTGLGIARLLAGVGMRIYGIGSRKVFGNFSRYVQFHRSPDSQDHPVALCAFLKELTWRETQRPVIFPTRDHDVIFLDRYRAELEPHFRIPQPEREVLDNVLNKWKLFQIATTCNIPTPKTYMIHNEDELESMASSFDYPALLKPVLAAHWRTEKTWDAVGREKVILAHSKAHLLASYRRFKHLQPTVLLQEYIPGDDDDIYTFCSYRNADSGVVCHFNTRKVVQVPRGYGTGILVESTINDDISQCSEHLLE